jgi:S-adenosylmethionine hydrolase
MKSNSIVTLTTDFGLADTYVGTMKGVILSINPRCTIIDITHEIEPQDIMGAGLALSGAYNFFPEGTIHVAVVDPGVGSLRRPLLIETEKYFFVGPDNGIFSFIPAGKQTGNVFEMTDTSFFLPSPSSTFHGRDIFAPVAAHLSTGKQPECFGSRITDRITLDTPEAKILNTNTAEGEIIHIDRFGNLITNLSRDFVEKMTGGKPFRIEMKGGSSNRLLPNYAGAEEGELFCLFGSADRLEISVKNRSAEKMMNAGKGDTVIIRK